ncbi:hypothetical protein JRQ81_014668 [Phrynocephalus forsythii]|uniref:Uncharacterized protein n=1 Tax=Phrynocephalus forsythii TaxID=171643 RepID=A0A9Q1B3X3_9SAUR|nr:hypothetical protein JRQ81_014668 [Phrynocephalus forsythii]
MSTLGAEVKIKHLGERQRYLGVDMFRDPECNFYLCQTDKIEKLLQKCKMGDCKTVSTPMAVEFNRIPEDGKFSNVELYQSVLGSLMNLSSWSWPGISAAVNILSQHAAEPLNKHLKGIKHIL